MYMCYRAMEITRSIWDDGEMGSSSRPVCLSSISLTQLPHPTVTLHQLVQQVSLFTLQHCSLPQAYCTTAMFTYLSNWLLHQLHAYTSDTVTNIFPGVFLRENKYALSIRTETS